VLNVQINANGLWDDGRLVRSRWFMVDVTQRNLAENALVYLGAIVDSCAEAIIGTNPEGIIVSWNEGAVQLYQYSAAEAQGRPIHILKPASRPEDAPEMFAQILSGRCVDTHDTFHQCKDGRIIPVSVTRSAIRDHDGRIIGISSIERDITHQKQEEQEQLFLIQELSRAAVGKPADASSN
jgi:PAS domain S-box-containing protein